MRACSIPGSLMSTVNRTAPVTLARPSWRGTGLPITRSASFTGSGGGSSSGYLAFDLGECDAGDADWEYLRMHAQDFPTDSTASTTCG